ncbi:hypothetical protein [Kitasatospora sp. SolWspMP-SS2h]|uniref:hypothetical protein n=1 Tax=Kitasatospora sp. SolWspMP-SS2h TaxID=1305729 RepID=UPI00131491E6|nr:hypothetical protein [Kitasatospora sp. SolWspMP-SS2h]
MRTHLAAHRDRLLVDTTHWHTDPDLSALAGHVGHLGVLVELLHHWTRGLEADGHHVHSRLALAARSAAITALTRMARVHETLAALRPAATRPDALGVQHTTGQARYALACAVVALDAHLVRDHRGDIPGRPTHTQPVRGGQRSS